MGGDRGVPIMFGCEKPRHSSPVMGLTCWGTHVDVWGWKPISSWVCETIQIQLQISVFIIVFADVSGIFISCLHGSLINSCSKLDWDAKKWKSKRWMAIVRAGVIAQHLIITPSMFLLLPFSCFSWQKKKMLTAPLNSLNSDFSITPKDDKWGFHYCWWAHHENDIMM